MHWCEEINSVRNFSYSLTDTRYTLMGRHEQRQQPLLHPNWHSLCTVGKTWPASVTCPTPNWHSLCTVGKTWPASVTCPTPWLILVMYCWEDINSVSNFSYTLTDTRHVLLGRHEQRQQLVVHPNWHSLSTDGKKSTASETSRTP
jgi:hypothetical protein